MFRFIIDTYQRAAGPVGHIRDDARRKDASVANEVSMLTGLDDRVPAI